ncbi:hypothetical protein H8D85_00260 [bacterium]|nr:hypothetical protein [bacterium]
MSYAEMFTRPTRRKGEIGQLLLEIGGAVQSDIEKCRQQATMDIAGALTLLIKININFHQLFMKVRWADGYNERADIRYELADIQKIIDDTRYDLKTLAALQMNENNNAM